MGGNKPKAIITDQDPAIRQGVLSVFEGCTHRYCMWHIMRKLPEKVGHLLNVCEDFLERIKLCVWASDTPEEFEAKLADMLVHFNLGSNDWLKHIYDIREDWVQVYFKEDFLGGIMKTMSGSESQNAMFGNLTTPILSLVEFWVRFVHALESQRYRESKAENASLTSLPELKTPLDIEKHGRVMYTHTNFYIFRDQLCDALFNCEILSISTVEGDNTYKIEDKRHQRYRYVVYNKES